MYSTDYFSFKFSSKPHLPPRISCWLLQAEGCHKLKGTLISCSGKLEQRNSSEQHKARLPAWLRLVAVRMQLSPCGEHELCFSTGQLFKELNYLQPLTCEAVTGVQEMPPILLPLPARLGKKWEDHMISHAWEAPRGQEKESRRKSALFLTAGVHQMTQRILLVLDE